MAVKELPYGDAQSKKEYREQRARYEAKKKKAKKKKAQGTVKRGIGKAARQGRELDKLIEELKR